MPSLNELGLGGVAKVVEGCKNPAVADDSGVAKSAKSSNEAEAMAALEDVLGGWNALKESNDANPVDKGTDVTGAMGGKDANEFAELARVVCGNAEKSAKSSEAAGAE